MWTLSCGMWTAVYMTAPDEAPGPRQRTWLALTTIKNTTNSTEYQDCFHSLPANVVPGHPSPRRGLWFLSSVSSASPLLVTRNFWTHPVIQWPNYTLNRVKFWNFWESELSHNQVFTTAPKASGRGHKGREATSRRLQGHQPIRTLDVGGALKWSPTQVGALRLEGVLLIIIVTISTG